MHRRITPHTTRQSPEGSEALEAARRCGRRAFANATPNALSSLASRRAARPRTNRLRRWASLARRSHRHPITSRRPRPVAAHDTALPARWSARPPLRPSADARRRPRRVWGRVYEGGSARRVENHAASSSPRRRSCSRARRGSGTGATFSLQRTPGVPRPGRPIRSIATTTPSRRGACSPPPSGTRSSTPCASSGPRHCAQTNR
jgi:hypothetical protein